jgi:hypothetical protein
VARLLLIVVSQSWVNYYCKYTSPVKVKVGGGGDTGCASHGTIVCVTTFTHRASLLLKKLLS